MIAIRALTERELPQAVSLRISSWTEELVGKAENTLTQEGELAFWLNWMRSAEAHSDVRVLLGAFNEGLLVGAAFASFADEEDLPEKGIELNGLWVAPLYRKRGLSLKLLNAIFEVYLELGMEKLVVYNHHYCSSNSFYHKYGAEVVKQVYQMDGQLLVDVFVADLRHMQQRVLKSLEKV